MEGKGKTTSKVAIMPFPAQDVPTKGTAHHRDDTRYRISLHQQMAAACTGALVTSMIVTPFDVVKIRLQTQQKTMLSDKCYLYNNGLMDHLYPCGPCSQVPGARPPQMQKHHFKGTIDAFVKIVHKEGIGALWSGLGPTLVLAVPATVVYFVAYEQICIYIQDEYKGTTPMWSPLIAGGMARAGAVTLVSPLELIRTKMQSKKVSYTDIGLAIRAQVQSTGWYGLWRGLGPTLMRDVPFSGIYWLHYEFIKKNFTSEVVPTFWLNFMAGAISGTIAAFVTTPFDVVKTHQQIELGEKEIYAEAPKTRSFEISFLPIIRRIYQQYGIKGLFTGLVPRLVKVAPACAIMISTFEYGKKYFSQKKRLSL